MTCNRISAAILAGGEAKRLGGVTKSRMMVQGEYIISRMIRVLEDIFEEIIIITNSAEEFREFKNCRTAGDIFLKRGPLGGIHAALHNSIKNDVFVFAGDMPFLSRRIIGDQIEQYFESRSEALVPVIGNNIEPLHALYNITMLGTLTSYLRDATDYSVRDFLEKLNVNYMQIKDDEESRLAFTNINTPGDLSSVQGKMQKRS